MSTDSTSYFDKGTTTLFNQLGNNHSNIHKLKQFIQEQEFDYELIIDDIEGPEDESDILDVVGEHLYNEIKSLICSTQGQNTSHINEESLPLSLEMSRDINHSFNYDDQSLTLPHQQSINIHLSDDTDSDDWDEKKQLINDETEHKYNTIDINPQIQNLIELLQQLSNKEGTELIQQFLLEQNYSSIETIKEDIENANNSIIYEELEKHNIDITFFSAFCSKVREIDNQKYIENAIIADDEWSVILQRMMRNTTFSNKDYQITVNYFRENQWTVKDYRDDEIGAEYESSYFHEIFPEITHNNRKKIIKIFDNCIINKPQNMITPQGPAPNNNNNNNANNNYNIEEKKQDSAPLIQIDNIQIDSQNKYDYESEEIEGNVDEEHHPRYTKVEGVINRCAAMVRPRSNAPTHDCDLKALCSILSINVVLEISNIFCRQYLVPLYHRNQSQCNKLLREISTNPDVMVLLEKFVDKSYWKKPHDKQKFSLYFVNSLNLLQLLRYLGYSTPPICKLSFNANMEIKKLHCSARDVQIYVFGFLISSTRMLIKNFENTNVTLILDMKFAMDHYVSDEGTMDVIQLRRQSMKDLQSKIMKFEEPFENNQVRSDVVDAIEKHCMMVQKIDFNRPKNSKGRWNNLKFKVCAANKKHLGFEVNDKEYMQLYDGCELFQLCRVKRYLMEQTEGHGASIDRLCISLHKFGNTLKFYLHFDKSVFRLRVQDLCEWFPSMFEKYDTALRWDQMKNELRKSLRDNEKLADIMHSGIMAVNQFNFYNNNKKKAKPKEKTNFWKNIYKWSDLDKEFYKKCDKFTYEMKKKYGMKYNHNVFDQNIVDKESVIKRMYDE